MLKGNFESISNKYRKDLKQWKNKILTNIKITFPSWLEEQKKEQKERKINSISLFYFYLINLIYDYKDNVSDWTKEHMEPVKRYVDDKGNLKYKNPDELDLKNLIPLSLATNQQLGSSSVEEKQKDF